VSRPLAYLSFAAAIAVAPAAAQPPVPPVGQPPVGQPPVAAAVADTGTAGMRRALGDTSLIPAEDQARGVDAEIRASLFQLMNGEPVPALSRLQWLASSPTVLGTANDAVTLRMRENMLFLLAEAYYTLGMDEAFRGAARQLVGPIGMTPPAAPTPPRADAAATTSVATTAAGAGGTSARYAPILRTQLMLDAYRRGDYNGAIQLSRSSASDPRSSTLASLVGGLAHYQLGHFTDARTSFAAAAGGGGAYAQYGRYMDALTQLRSDTANAAPVLGALQSLASSTQGEFADQVRLTGAQLAFEMEQYPTAVQLADGISRDGGLAAQALFTRAWAQYKADQIEPAGQSFAQFATQYPDLPEREESRLMHAQSLLQLGRTAEAATIFRSVADSAAMFASTLQARSRGAMTDAARALVQARAAGLLFLRDPASGKTVALQDAAGAEAAVLASIFADSVPALPAVTAPEIVSLADVNARLATVGPVVDTAVPRRIVFAPVSATRNATDFIVGAQGLYEADVSVALARHRLDEQLEAQQRHLALLRRFHEILTAETGAFDTVAFGLRAAHDSLARVSEALSAASTRLTQMFMAQVLALRLLADENAAALDSVRRGLQGAIAPGDEAVLEYERQTTQSYRNIATLVENGLAGAIRLHPIFALGDSVARRGERTAALLDSARAAAAETQRLLAAAITDAENMETDRVRSLRATLASAETMLRSAESRVIAIIDAELRARAGEVVALLNRDTEAAEFGSASALFFQTLDAERPAGTTGAGAPTGAAPPAGTASTGVRPRLPPAPIKPRQ
jgi:tetratricopeptide (TPR) repeat protein